MIYNNITGTPPVIWRKFTHFIIKKGGSRA